MQDFIPCYQRRLPSRIRSKQPRLLSLMPRCSLSWMMWTQSQRPLSSTLQDRRHQLQLRYSFSMPYATGHKGRALFESRLHPMCRYTFESLTVDLISLRWHAHPSSGTSACLDRIPNLFPETIHQRCDIFFPTMIDF